MQPLRGGQDAPLPVLDGLRGALLPLGLTLGSQLGLTGHVLGLARLLIGALGGAAGPLG